MSDLKWLTIMPLIGGLPIGAEKAIGKPPEAILSYSEFTANDSQYVNYMQNTRALDIPFLHLNNESHSEQIDKIGDVDIVVGVPLCGGLSMLNTSKDAKVAGSLCEKNKYISWIFKDAITKFNAKCVMIENAPALATPRGDVLNKQLQELAAEYGYAYSIYETSTEYHGIPQKRNRTFAMMWKSETAPLLEYFKKEMPSLRGFFKLENDESEDITTDVTDEVFYQYIKYKCNENPRKILIDNKITTCLKYVLANGLLDEVCDFADMTKVEKWKHIAHHAKHKYSVGESTWDASVKIYDIKYNAFISKNYKAMLHPTEDRSLTVNESLAIMGMPADFVLVGGKKRINMVAQNVPVSTAADIVSQFVKYLNNELRDSGSQYVHQDNHKQMIRKQSSEINLLNEFM